MPEARPQGPVKPQAIASSRFTTPVPYIRSRAIRFFVTSLSISPMFRLIWGKRARERATKSAGTSFERPPIRA